MQIEISKVDTKTAQT